MKETLKEIYEIATVLKKVMDEEKLSNFEISDITKKAIKQNGINDPILISATIQEDGQKKDLELLFEVESTADEHHKVDLKGNQKESQRGYAVVLRFKDVEEVKEDTIQDIVDKKEVVVHCDCPAFYYQGMQQDDSVNGNARYKFLGSNGSHVWTMKHAHAGGKTGKALCKHLESVKEWLDTKNNLDSIVEKLN